MIRSFFFNHPTMLTITLVLLIAAVAVLFVWNVILTISVKKLSSKKKSAVKCANCGCEQISIVKQTGNEGHKTLNVCQKCGYSWEIGR